MLSDVQREADALLAAGDHAHALPEFRVLAESWARRDGPYSVRHLANLHNALRCMCSLQLWADCVPVSAELYAKYRRTHGPGDGDTVDVAKCYAWALVQLRRFVPASEIYLAVADAVWDLDSHHERALAMLGAGLAHHRGACLDHLNHAEDFTVVAAALMGVLPAPAGWLTIEGYRPTAQRHG